MTRAALRGLLVTALLVVLYYQLPLHQHWGVNAAVRVLAGLLVFAGSAAWQVRAITGSPYPQVKAVEVLGLILPLYLLVFASTYYVMERASVADFTQPLTRTDALYFTVTVFSTVGFGDIVPRAEAARRAHGPDARRPRPAGCRRADPAGRRAPRPAAENGSGRQADPVHDLTGIAWEGVLRAGWNARQGAPGDRSIFGWELSPGSRLMAWPALDAGVVTLPRTLAWARPSGQSLPALRPP